MDQSAILQIVDLGVAGVGLYLFATGKLLSKTTVDALIAKIVGVYEKQIVELRRDRDEWKKLALGTEQRFDRVVPVVATTIGASPVESHAP